MSARGAPAQSWGKAFSLRRVRWLQLDWHVLMIALALLGTGLMVLGAMAEADELFQRPSIDLLAHYKKLAVAFPALILGLLVRPRWLRRNAYALYGLTLLLLVLVAVVGQERNNARRWIQLPIGFDLQPSELAKLGLILALARVLYRRRFRSGADWLWPGILALVPMAMVAVQPDLGTALAIAPIALGMLYLAGASGPALLGSLLIGGALGYCAWRFEWVLGYQLQRVDTWLDSFSPQALIDARNGAAFHTYHARLAIGNGGFFGRGLGHGVVNEAAHLPMRDSDSIFAVLAEETGFLGSFFICALYVLLVLLLMGSAASVRERFSRLVVGGIALYFAAHFFINVGVNVGLIPMTGLPLPLLSTGGSSLLVTFAALGLALGLSSHREPSLDQDAFRV